MSDKKDTIYASKLDTVSSFAFDETVVDVFDDMVHRSIPGYPAIVRQVGAFARRFVQPGTNIYDLGCSLGTCTFAMRHVIPYGDCQIIAVDMSESMIRKCSKALERDVGIVPVYIRMEDVCLTPMNNASMVVMNFTLQFIPSLDKDKLVKKIFDSLVPGGVFVLSEKIVFQEARDQNHIESLYFDLKRHNGYNDLEISQKRDALEDVLKMETMEQHSQRLHGLGFTSVTPWFQCLNFASFLAIK